MNEQAERLRIGLVGFGTGGLYFHAPFIEAAQGVELVGVVTRSADRRRVLAEQFPGVPVYDSLADLAREAEASGGIDAVTITTPPQTRREPVLDAVGLGLHVVADKPFAPTAEAAAELDEAARRAGLILGVYHNRRWDSDILTVKAVLDSGELGSITRFHSRFDQDAPGLLEGGPTGGLLRDLGSHLVDQALWLFGPVDGVFARLDETQTAAVLPTQPLCWCNRLTATGAGAGGVEHGQHVNGVLGGDGRFTAAPYRLGEEFVVARVVSLLGWDPSGTTCGVQDAPGRLWLAAPRGRRIHRAVAGEKRVGLHIDPSRQVAAVVPVQPQPPFGEVVELAGGQLTGCPIAVNE
jgi:predicted dehydrogenase